MGRQKPWPAPARGRLPGPVAPCGVLTPLLLTGATLCTVDFGNIFVSIGAQPR